MSGGKLIRNGQEYSGGIIINRSGGSGGTSNYNDLSNKPKINGTTLTGDKSLEDIGIDYDDIADVVIEHLTMAESVSV